MRIGVYPFLKNQKFSLDTMHSSLTKGRKRKCFQVLIEELSRPEVDISQISYHTTMMASMMRQQNVMIIPKILEQLKSQSEPLVLEITNYQQQGREGKGQVPAGGDGDGPKSAKLSKRVVVADFGEKDLDSTDSSHKVVRDEHSLYENVHMERITPLGVDDESSVEPPIEGGDEESSGEKQFEIVFSDSIRQSGADPDGDDDNHIVHFTAEQTATSTSQQTGTGTGGPVNVPNSFPLFQLVHTGEVPEDVQQEIVRLIREANPQLDLNSITFNFKSPQTVEIIANVNS